MKTKYTSQTAPKPSWKKVILLAITALALFASAGVALAADCLPQTTWTDHAGSWFTAANWNNGVPGSGTAALINNGGTAQISASLPAANACSLTLGGAGHSGNVSVSTSGSLTVTYGIVVGDTSATGTCLLAVNSGSSVTAASVHVYPSGTLTGNATVTTPNGGTTTVEGTLSPNWTLTINGNLTFVGITGPLMQCNVTPSNSGNDAHVTGTATLTGHLSVTMTGTFSSGTNRYTLLYAEGGRNGTTFSTQSITYDPNQGFTPYITYSSDGKYVYLDLVWNQ
jgi:hypothetical protein